MYENHIFPSQTDSYMHLKLYEIYTHSDKMLFNGKSDCIHNYQRASMRYYAQHSMIRENLTLI